MVRLKLGRAVVFGVMLFSVSPLIAAEYDARLAWTKRVEMGALITGMIKTVQVEPGQRIKKGQSLLRFDDRGIRAEQTRAKAELNRAEKERAEAQRELERAEELYDRTLLSQHDLETAHLDYARAEAAYHAAQAALTAAGLDLEYSVLKAPFDAFVIERRAEPGQTVVARMENVPLVTIADATRMQARFSLPLNDMQSLSLGTAAVVIAGGRRYEGKVSSIGLEPAREDTSRYPVAVEFKLGDEILRAGQAVKVELQ